MGVKGDLTVAEVSPKHRRAQEGVLAALKAPIGTTLWTGSSAAVFLGCPGKLSVLRGWKEVPPSWAPDLASIQLSFVC